MNTIENMTPEQMANMQRAMLKLVFKAIKQTPGATETLGRIALETPEGQEVLALAFLMQARGEL